MNIISKYLKQVQIDQILTNLFSKSVSLILIFILFFIAKRIASWAFKLSVEKSIVLSHQNEARQKTLIKLLHNVMNYVLYFFLIYWILSVLGVPISSLLAGAGLAGVAIGLGAQGFLSDVVNGFFILLENQYDVGDSVEIDQVIGSVSSVGIRTTQVRGLDGTLHFIPNRNITIVSNKSRGDILAQIDIPIFAHTDLKQMTDIIKSVNDENLLKYPEITGVPNVLGPQTLKTGQLVFRVGIFVKSGTQNHIYSEFYRLYQAALVANKIQLPTVNTNSTTNP